MRENVSELLNQVIATIKKSIGEDWIEHFDIDMETSINGDLELESIDFIGIAEQLQLKYGDQVNFVAWVSDKDISEIIALTVGDLVLYIDQQLSECKLKA